MPTLEQNLLIWGNYHWSHDGDEWDDQAAFCGVPYAEWKRTLAETFLVPELRADATVLEIAPGHGRWSEIIATHVHLGRCVLCDVSPACAEFCRQRFAAFPRVEVHVNDGRSLPFLDDATVDFVWSFDSFVHIEHDETRSYLLELARVLRPGGRACIHHAGEPSDQQRAQGWRCRVTRQELATMAAVSGLRVISQTDSWGDGGSCNCKAYGDCITVVER